MPLYSTYSDENLVLLLQSGERRAFDEIYERYWNKLFITATHRLGNPHEAEDIVQDIMFNLWKNRSSFSPRVTLGTYLSVAAKYEVINRMAKEKRQQDFQSSANDAEADYSTEQHLDLAALQQRLSVLVNALPEKCRMAFTLSREHGYSQKKIAEEMNISENTVESHIKKAIKDLKTGLRNFLFNFLG